MIKDQRSEVRGQSPVGKYQREFIWIKAPNYSAKKRCISLLTLQILLSALFGTLTLCAGAQSTTDRFLWDQANSQMINASNPKENLNAARTYQRLLQNGIANPALLNNLGCALTMGKDYANAVLAFDQAERYAGTTLETREGITAALARRNNSTSTELPWYRTALFWHFELPARMRIITALAGWSLLWIGILLLILRRRRKANLPVVILTLSETCMITGALIFLLFGSSSLFSLMQERQVSSHWKAAAFSSMDIPEATL